MIKRIIPIVLIAACSGGASETPPPDWIVGKYQYTGNGNVAGKFPWEAKANLLLDRDGQYTLAVEVHINDEEGGDTDRDESYGTYNVEGDRLVIHPADDDGDSEEFEIRDRRLIPKLPWAARATLKGLKIPDPVFVKTK